MPICTICLSPHLAEVDDALSVGATVREVAARFGFSKSAVGRHRSGCLAPKLAAAARLTTPAAEVRAPVDRAKAIAAGQAVPTAIDALSLAALLQRLERSLSRLEGAADAAASDGLHAALAAVSGQLHRGIETAGKIQGLYAEPKPLEQEKFTININLASVLQAPAASARSSAELPLACDHRGEPEVDVVSPLALSGG